MGSSLILKQWSKRCRLRKSLFTLFIQLNIRSNFASDKGVMRCNLTIWRTSSWSLVSSTVNILLHISKYLLFWHIQGFKWFLSMPYWRNKFSILQPFWLKRQSKCFAKQVIINRWHYIFLRIGQSDTSKIIIKLLYTGFFWKSGDLCSTEWQNIFIIA